MAQKEDLSSVEITNPTGENFTWNYNGEPYTVKANEMEAFAKPVSYHLAKHLSTKMVVDAAMAKMTKKEEADPKAAIHVKISQLSTYDTHERRIALFKILKDVDKVVELITRYPFKGFIGDMNEYKTFVESQDSKKQPVKTG